MSMRIAVIPAVGSKKCWYTDSSFTVFHHLISAMKGRVYAYFCFDWDVSDEIPEQFKSDHIEYVCLDKHFMGFREHQRNLDTDYYEIFHPLFGKPVDAVLTSRLGGVLDFFVQCRYGSVAYGCVPIIPVELMTDCFMWNLTDEEEQQRMSVYASMPVVMLREGEKKAVRRHMSEFYNPSVIERSLNRIESHCQGVVMDNVIELAKSVEKHKTFTLFYGGRFNKIKKWQDTLKSLSYAYRGGREVQIHALCATNKEVSVYMEKNFPEVKLFRRVPHNDYIKLIARCHAALVLSKFESFPVGFIEQMCTGIPVVVMKADWSLEVLGEDYPFYITDRDTQPVAAIKWIMDNYEAACEKMKPVLDMVREKYHIDVCADWYYDKIERETVRTSFPLSYQEDEILQLLKEKFPDDKFTLEDAFDAMFKKFKWCKADSSIATGIVPIGRRDVYRFLNSNFIDTLESEINFKGRRDKKGVI